MHTPLRSVLENVNEAARRFWQRRFASSASPHAVAHPLGVALGSGGLRGGAHIGVLNVLEKEGWTPDLLAGTSAGAVVAVLKGAGASAQDLRDAAAELEPSLFTDLTALPFQLLTASVRALYAYLNAKPHPAKRVVSGLIRGQRFEQWLRARLGERRFEELNLPVFVVATDLGSGEAIVFGSERLSPALPAGFRYVTGVDVVRAVRASAAIPMVFEPVCIDGRLLVDGAFSEPVPASVLRHAGARHVVAVDLSLCDFPALQASACDSRIDNQNLFSVLGRATSILTDRYARASLEQAADLVIRPQSTPVPLTAVGAVDAFIANGQMAAAAALDQVPTKKQRRNERGHPTKPYGRSELYVCK